MQGLKRNETEFYYATVSSNTETTNSDGEYTGGRTITYNTPVKASANISKEIGSIVASPFGITDNVYRRITTCNMSLPIAEDSILWVGITPDANGEAGLIKHNYKVQSIGKSLNSVTYQILKVSVQ